MSEGMTQEELDRHTRERLAVIVPLLELLSTQEDEQDGGFSDDGLSTIRAVRIAAWDGAAYLGEEIMGKSTGHHDISLVYDVQQFLAITACALNGMEVNGAPWIDSPHSVRYLRDLARGLQERAEGEAASTSKSKPNPACIHGIPGCTCVEDVLGPAKDPSDAEMEEMVRESATRIRKLLPTSLAEIEDVYNDLLFLSNAISGEEPHA